MITKCLKGSGPPHGGQRKVLWRWAAAAALLPVPALADCGPAVLERAVLERVTPQGDLQLKDARLVRLAGLHVVAPDRAAWPQPGAPLALGLLDDKADRWGRLPALVFTLAEGETPLWLQQALVGRGAAVARPEQSLGACWPLLAAAEAGAERASPALPAEGGRFARVLGRVSRVGEGRSAHFVTLWDAGGARVTGLVQKRHLGRFRQAGVDVLALRGHLIRLRGVRSVANPALIPLLAADQIEIVR